MGQEHGVHSGAPDGGQGASLRQSRRGGAKVFYPAVAREEAAAAETESLLSRVYHGSVGLMVSTLLQNRRISREELKELQALLDQGEEEQT